MTVQDLKLKIAYIDNTTTDFELMSNGDTMKPKQCLRDLDLANWAEIMLFVDNKELQVNSEPRAAAVKAESIKLMQLLQQSLREKQKLDNYTIDSQGSFEDDAYEANGEQGKGTPRPSNLSDVENPYPGRNSEPKDESNFAFQVMFGFGMGLIGGLIGLLFVRR